MSEWKEYKLKDVSLKITKGTTPSTLGSEFVNGGINFIKAEAVTKEGAIDESKFHFIDESTHQKLKRSQLEKDDILFSMAGVALGKTALVKDKHLPANTNQALALIRLNRLILNPTFVRYYLSQNKIVEFINSSTAQSAQPNINLAEIGDLKITAPDLPTQTAIAEILSSLDDKIELNNKINEELENLAQTLFKQWFIDFEFPNENGEPYKSAGGEMVESELGEIPKRWETIKVFDLDHKLQTGTRPKGGVGGITEGVPSIGAESIKKLGYFDFSKTKYVTEEFASKMKRGCVGGFELLIYKDGGKPGTFIPHFSMFGEGFPFEKFFINEHVFLLDFYNKPFNCFCYFFFDSEYVKPVFENNGGKAAIPGINQEDVRNLSIFKPNIKIVEEFSEFAFSSVSTILKNCKENQQLIQLRDTILPKLISGELEITEIPN